MDLTMAAQIFLEKQTADGTLPGAQFALVSDTGFKSGCIGNRQIIPSPKPVLPDTMYDLASLSKVIVTTTLLLQWLENERLQLTTPVSSVLPDFPYPAISIGMLLTHTSGMAADDKRYKECADKDVLHVLTARLHSGNRSALFRFRLYNAGYRFGKGERSSLGRIGKEVYFRSIEHVSYDVLSEEIRCRRTVRRDRMAAGKRHDRRRSA